MYLFSRILTTQGSPRQVLPWVTQITDHVNANSPLAVSAWLANFGAPLGTVGWSTIVESQSALVDGTAGLMTDSAYLDLVEAGAPLVVGPGEDHLRQLVYGSPGEPPPLGAVAVTTTATAVVDRMGEAVTWSIEIAQHVEAVIGSPIAVLLDSYGTMGQITWIGVTENMAAADAAADKTAADASYLGKLADSAGLFIPGSGHRTQLTRIA
jgi:hypothetical protein